MENDIDRRKRFARECTDDRKSRANLSIREMRELGLSRSATKRDDNEKKHELRSYNKKYDRVLGDGMINWCNIVRKSFVSLRKNANADLSVLEEIGINAEEWGGE